MKTLALVAALAISPLLAHAALLEPGAPFPTWSLRDQTGAVVTSQSLAGKSYLLWFYPRAQTPGCTAEGQGLRDNFPAFQEKGVEVLGVSFDDPAANAKFVAAEKFPFRLLSDSDRTLATAVGAADSKDQATARRISYLVGPDGTVRATYGTVTPATHATDVLGGMKDQ